jgi:DnaJ-class molecular chaperone
MTLYETLEVSEGASKETIHAAYRSLAKRFHPDVASTPAAAQRMALITEAYSVLSDDAKRAQYDGQLREIREKKQAGSNANGNASGNWNEGWGADRGRGAHGQGKGPQAPPPSGRGFGVGMSVEDFAIGMLETHLLPVVPQQVAAAYPFARNDIRTLISIGLERLVH